MIKASLSGFCCCGMNIPIKTLLRFNLCCEIIDSNKVETQTVVLEGGPWRITLGRIKVEQALVQWDDGFFYEERRSTLGLSAFVIILLPMKPGSHQRPCTSNKDLIRLMEHLKLPSLHKGGKSKFPFLITY